MVDEYADAVQSLVDLMMRSDSSMVDEYVSMAHNGSVCSSVQIPLWSMNTRVLEHFADGKTRSDSSMVDEYSLIAAVNFSLR